VSLYGDFRNGLVAENALIRLMIGLCSALAVSTRFENGIFMGLAATFVLVCSNIMISAMRKLIPDAVRIPIFIVIIASFVTIVDLVMRAYFPPIYDRLGVWIPLIVVNCIILGRAEAFAYKRGVLPSAMDGIGMGIGYTAVLLIMGFIRELLGTGKLIVFDATLIAFPAAFDPPRFMVSFPGAFLTFGLMIAALNWYQDWRKGK
jgi:electron transport complex protein RnfE